MELRKRWDKNFDDLFARGYRAYLEGNWQVAGKTLKQLLKMRPNAGPTRNLNKVVNVTHKGKAPETWKGYRPLTSK